MAALQLRRPRSLRPQGIVNMAVALLDAAHPLCGASDSPGAFAVRDLVARRPAWLCKIAECSEEERRPAGVGEERSDQQAFVDHSGRLEEPGGAAVEQRKLELTLEKWKADLVRNKPDWSCVCVGVSRVRVQDSCTGLLAAGMSRRRAFRRARREARSCA